MLLGILSMHDMETNKKLMSHRIFWSRGNRGNILPIHENLMGNQDLAGMDPMGKPFMWVNIPLATHG